MIILEDIMIFFDNIKKSIYVEVLCTDKTLRGSIILPRLFRDFLVLKGYRFVSDPETNKIMHGFVHCFIDSDSDRAYGGKKLTTLNSEVATIFLLENVCTQPIENFVDIKIGHNMVLGFRRHDKFSEKIGQNVSEYIINA